MPNEEMKWLSKYIILKIQVGKAIKYLININIFKLFMIVTVDVIFRLFKKANLS